jgi:hypothetical protein
MIAIVNILDSRGNVMNKQIGLWLGLGTEEECLKRIPKENTFYCWNKDYNGKELLVKVI